jgi:hypothetical protein
VNRDLRRWRPNAAVHNREAMWRVADCKAKLKLLDWAGSWQRVREPGYTSDPAVAAQMHGDMDLIMAAVKDVALAYRDRDGWRPEWERG